MAKESPDVAAASSRLFNSVLGVLPLVLLGSAVGVAGAEIFEAVETGAWGVGAIVSSVVMVVLFGLALLITSWSLLLFLILSGILGASLLLPPELIGSLDSVVFRSILGVGLLAVMVDLINSFHHFVSEDGQLTHSQLEGMTRKELYEMARQRNIQGRSGMTKSQLIEALIESEKG